MFSINKVDNLINEYSVDNCIFLINQSRPSKSLIDCEKFKDYSKLNFNIDILNEFSYIKSQSKTLESLVLRELMSVFKLEKHISCENISLSFDVIIINETNFNEDKKNLIFCLEKTPKIKNIIESLDQIIKEINDKDCLIISYIDLFTYPSAELLIIIFNMFEKIKIYYCKILKQNILYCKNYKNISNINLFIKNILKIWKLNVRQIGIYTNSTTLNLIKNHNIFIFDYYLNINKCITESTLEDKEYFFKHYCKKYSKNNYSPFECNHSFQKYNLEKCFICIKCYELFYLY